MLAACGTYQEYSDILVQNIMHKDMIQFKTLYAFYQFFLQFFFLKLSQYPLPPAPKFITVQINEANEAEFSFIPIPSYEKLFRNWYKYIHTIFLFICSNFEEVHVTWEKYHWFLAGEDVSVPCHGNSLIVEPEFVTCTRSYIMYLNCIFKFCRGVNTLCTS